MLVMALDEDQAASLLKHMSDNSLAKLRRAAQSLDVAELGVEEKVEAMRGFMTKRSKGNAFLGDPDDRFRKALAKAKGEAGLRRIYAEDEDGEPSEGGGMAPSAFLRSLPDEQFASALAQESPRCAAVILAEVPGSKAGRVLSLMDEEAREPVVGRMLATEKVAAEIAADVVAGFQRKLEESGASDGVNPEERRAQELAGIISALDKGAQDRVLGQVAERDPELADRVERLMFAFSDLPKVNDRSMQELARGVDPTQLALALKGAPAAIRSYFLDHMSERARERVTEESEMAGRVPMSTVELAREEVMKVARQMYRDGDLVLQMKDEQYVE